MDVGTNVLWKKNLRILTNRNLKLSNRMSVTKICDSAKLGNGEFVEEVEQNMNFTDYAIYLLLSASDFCL